MKAQLYDRIQTLVELQAEFSNLTIPKGTIGTIIECYTSPQEGYAIDLAIPDSSMVGGSTYENVILQPDQFIVCVQPAERAVS
jgi:Domain of unknown function (DUF4926)